MNPLAGLILCGGQSSRMGEDKCFLRYHDLPQWQHLSMMLRSLCAEVIVSCNIGQLSRLSQELPSLHHPPQLLADLPEFAGHGPMGGLLTAFHRYPGHSFLLVGCDYPLIAQEDLQLLIGARRKDHDVVCYFRDEEALDEPLVAVYENTSLQRIKLAFSEGEFSLRKVLQEVGTTRLKPANPHRLQSIDTPEAFQLVRERNPNPFLP